MNRNANISVFICAVVISAAAFAQQPPAVKPDSVGLSSERLERIGTAVQRGIDDKRIAGAVTLVARRGRVAWFKAQGMMDREAGKPMRPDTIFRICSMTKPITSVAVMMLYEEGRFLLDDPISKYLPEFKNPKVLVKPATGEPYTIPATREITIRDLLRHTSGLTYHWNPVLGRHVPERKCGTRAFALRRHHRRQCETFGGPSFALQPGERWEYSLGVDVLGRLVEVISGITLDEFFRVRIFEPLGMKDTYFYPPENKLDRLAVAYTYYEGKGSIAFPILRSRRSRWCTPLTTPTGVRRNCLPAARGFRPRRPITCVFVR